MHAQHARMPTPDPQDIRLDPDEARAPPPRRGRAFAMLAGTAAGLAAVAAWVWWSQQPQAPVVATAPPPAPAASAPPTPGDGEIDGHYPAPSADGLPPLAAAEVPAALKQLLGSAGEWLQADDFASRFTATVDNLARPHAPPLKWPVSPAPGRFTVESAPDGTQVIAASNAQRYAPFVAAASAVDSAAAARLYARTYPLLQQSYRQLGFPDRAFHERLVTVIDRLLAAPEPQGPVAVRLTEVKGPVASTVPWTRYEFADPALEKLSSGQKMLVRMGPDNERRLKQKLSELRAHLVQAQPAATR